MASEEKEYTERQKFVHLVSDALKKHPKFDLVPGGIKCAGCDWSSKTTNRYRQFRKHQAWAVSEEFGWPED
ncbi:hypothetical protein SEA_THUNDERCLAP_48 [Arthrobacter phage Thunderclap]|uniref:Uncharacterized protein n=6 Tax=Amigovirus amigo TaxID=1982100 RepID=A0A5J6THL7_9CAUD|nr:hypothetical protein FDH66_gp55 [Arthrobacter phage Amigo]QFG08342.1 hypothetical protein SEA_YEEZUS_48 [Arthrobacter phage Yeezus]QFG13390.1 hypothetical protein SEA_ICHOR_48 [Arthrobacter phage Ichor]QFG13908.1 hypothetical protein SEA_JAEK_48 [Arthrobacter phage Jaek]QJD51695.1 hypothetical protein SEA_BOERSMA_50 [Arthrobacter phage Boersma]QOR56103.1 hypothetical protein SEA_THUNDERCLAP_48 [Arthrobacter phage Thunderclap]